MPTDYHQKDSLPDLYHILGLTIDVCKEPNCNEIIHKAYIRRTKACHPDKYPDQKEMAEAFELVTRAYDILKNEKERNEYNYILSMNKQNSADYANLKKSAREFVKSLVENYPDAQESENNSYEREEWSRSLLKQKEEEFKEQMKILNTKHGFDPSLDKAPISQQDAKKKLLEMSQQRAAQDIECQPMKIFDEGEVFDPEKFNAVFDLIHQKEDNAIIAKESSYNSCTMINFSDFDNLDKIYVEDSTRIDTPGHYAYLNNLEEPIRKVTKEEIKGLKKADYYSGHNVLTDDYYKGIKDKLRERKSTTSELNKALKISEPNEALKISGFKVINEILNSEHDLYFPQLDDGDVHKKLDNLRSNKKPPKNLNQTNDG